MIEEHRKLLELLLAQNRLICAKSRLDRAVNAVRRCELAVEDARVDAQNEVIDAAVSECEFPEGCPK